MQLQTAQTGTFRSLALKPLPFWLSFPQGICVSGLKNFWRNAVALAVITLAAFGMTADAQAQYPTLQIAAASDLQPAMPAIAAAYEKETGTKLSVSFASSSALATQILNGSPVDVFLGADFSFPEKVVAGGLADNKEPIPYAQGTLVLWARKDSPAQPLSMDALSTGKVTRIAVADELHAPYGRAAYAAMRKLNILDTLKPKLVQAENVAQTAQFAETGNAQAAFISLTQASSQRLKDEGTFVYVPFVYPKILQCGIVVRTSKQLAEAHRFLDWLTSEKVQSQLAKFGLQRID